MIRYIHPKIYPTPSYFSPVSPPSSNQPPVVQTTLETTEEQIVVFIFTAVCIVCGFLVLCTALEIRYEHYFLQNDIWGNPIYHLVKLLYSFLLLGLNITLGWKFNQYKRSINYTNDSTRLTKAVQVILILAYIIFGYEIVMNSIQLIIYFYHTTRNKRVNTLQQQQQQL